MIHRNLVSTGSLFVLMDAHLFWSLAWSWLYSFWGNDQDLVSFLAIFPFPLFSFPFLSSFRYCSNQGISKVAVCSLSYQSHCDSDEEEQEFTEHLQWYRLCINHRKRSPIVENWYVLFGSFYDLEPGFPGKGSLSLGGALWG